MPKTIPTAAASTPQLYSGCKPTVLLNYCHAMSVFRLYHAFVHFYFFIQRFYTRRPSLQVSLSTAAQIFVNDLTAYTCAWQLFSVANSDSGWLASSPTLYQRANNRSNQCRRCMLHVESIRRRSLLGVSLYNSIKQARRRPTYMLSYRLLRASR